MAFHHSPKIVTNGLVLCLDAANRKSYSGTGTVWRDLAEGNSGTLTNAPIFNSANGGSIVFDGLDDYVVSQDYTFINNGISNISMFAWVYPKAYGGGVVTYGQWADQEYATGLGIRSEGYITWMINGVPNDPYGLDVNYTTNFIVPLNIWSFIGFIRTTTNLTICYNDSSVTFTPSQPGGGIITPNRFIIGSGNQNASRSKYLNGYISYVTVYKKSLSKDEVLQNYNATKGRFNL